jgi:uncharacterized membrane protein YagU involved in acid resistance
MTRIPSPFEQLIKGAVAGLIATVPMTIFMRSAWRMLPKREKYPLPPRLITRRLTQKTGVDNQLDADELTSLTLTLHFLFGAATGALYGVIEPRVPLNESIKGSLMGMAVWSGSYLGWIPAFHILPPATEHPWRRNLLMIVAHLVWGIALGLATRMMNARRSYIDLK